ncbi:hypothetical protein LTS18_009698, partial [Coniosporium uncinatum]
GARAFPTSTLYIISIIFQQSYTVYMTMLILPYTRPAWRLQAFILFVITAWWVQSWAWYSITGLLLTDAIHNMDFHERSRAGIPIWRTRFRFPTWIVYLALMVAGLIMQYIFTAWKTQDKDAELVAHATLYESGDLNRNYDPSQPQARDDNYLLLLGWFLMLEHSDVLKGLMGNPIFKVLGRRSLSIFLTQSIILSTAGIALFLRLSVTAGLNDSAASVVVLVVMLPFVAVASEAFYRGVELPAQWAAKWLFKFMTS